MTLFNESNIKILSKIFTNKINKIREKTGEEDIAQSYKISYKNDNNLMFNILRIYQSDDKYEVEVRIDARGYSCVNDGTKLGNENSSIEDLMKNTLFCIRTREHLALEDGFKEILLKCKKAYYCDRCEIPSKFSIETKLCLTCLLIQSETEKLSE